MKSVPRFRRRTRDAVEAYASRALAHEAEATYLRRLIAFDDGHFRAVFDPAYFRLAAGQAPSKSQWNTLKKRFKRLDPTVFLFKEHGETRCDPDQPDMNCYYLDFGFFENR